MMDNILDAVIAHAILFERYKLYLEQSAAALRSQIEKTVRREAGKVRERKYSAMRKMKFNATKKRMVDEVSKVVDAYFEVFEREMRKFAAEEAAIIGAYATDFLTVEQTKSLYGVRLFTDGDADEIMKTLKGQVLGATGLLWADMINQSRLGFTQRIAQKMQIARTDDLTTNDFVDTVTKNDPVNNGAALTAIIENQTKTLLATLAQHAHAIIAAGVFSIFTSWYEWVSVLDSRTTEICRSRDGRKYQYGQGPQPPAHYNCRSRIAPLSRDNLDGFPQMALDAWAARQDPKFLRSAFGDRTAVDIMAGKVDLDKLVKLIDKKPLTLNDYSRLTRQFTAKG
jgi:SPP1 gp7 family putative phage head morphogenesis protein